MSKRIKNKKSHSKSQSKSQSKGRQSKQQSLNCVTFRKELALAEKHLHLKQNELAANIYQKILIQEPNHPCSNYFMGVLLHTANQSYAGIPYLKKVVDLRPEHIKAQLVLIDMYLNTDLVDEADELLQSLLAQKPRNSDALFRLGKLNQQRGLYEKAEDNFQKAFKYDRSMVTALVNHAKVCAALGNSKMALKLFRRAREIRPSFGEAHYGIALLNKSEISANDISLMEKAYKSRQINSYDKAYLCYALGKVNDDLKKYEKAFEYFSEANRLKRETFPIIYNIDQDASYFEKIKQVFDNKFIKTMSLQQNRSITPVFILGMPRSGTSLAEQILASHSQVYGAGELEDINNLVNEIQARTGKQFPGALEKLADSDWAALADQYINNVSRKTAAKFVTDKRPYNFRYIGLIAKIFPNAKIIHCLRNPFATCFSIYRYHFSMSEPYATDLQDLGKYYSIYKDLMAYWDQQLPGRIFNLRYENLIKDPAEEITAMLDYCDLPFEESCLEFFQTDRSVNTPSAAQVRQPIYTSAMEHWQHYEKQLQPLKTAMNLS